jgi:GDPmannose 4,6-dehydratase
MVAVDVTDAHSVASIVEQLDPHEIYNLAAMSHVGSSWATVDPVFRTNLLGLHNILEAVRLHSPDARVYQASSSEMYGNINPPQDEVTPMRPVSPYGVSKLAAHHLAGVYRLSHGLFVSCGICHNHESERRSPMFLSRKVARGVAAIVHGTADTLTLGNMEARRDFGYAPDYVEAMWMMLQQESPDDFVIATGQSHSVAELVEAAFSSVGLVDWRQYVRADPALVRPTEIHRLLGSAKKAERILGWRPTVGFYDMIGRMVKHEVEALKEGP